VFATATGIFELTIVKTGETDKARDRVALCGSFAESTTFIVREYDPGSEGVPLITPVGLK
jgi:hypothetical protein